MPTGEKAPLHPSLQGRGRDGASPRVVSPLAPFGTGAGGRAGEAGTFGVCDCALPIKDKRQRSSFAAGIIRTLNHAMEAEELAARNALLQGLDPRIKVAGALILIVSVTMLHSLPGLALIFAFSILLALASKVSLGRLMRQVWIGVAVFTGVIALPAPFLVPGEVIATIPVVGWSISLQGLRSGAFLLGRAETAATIAALLVLTTRWPHVLKALRALGVPVAVVAVLGMTHRYIFVLLTTSAQMLEARQARALRPLTASEQRRLIVSSAGVLLGKTLAIAGEVHLAMIARGYRGEVRLIDDFHLRKRDGAALLLTVAIAATIFWHQR
jgi:cobalt/nickel transport system permease protein